MADIFDEIGEDLRAERARQLFARYGWVLALLAVLILVGAGGWQWWHRREQAMAARAAGVFLAATQAISGPSPGTAETPARKQAAADFAKLAASGPESYRTLARLRLAALQAITNPEEALATWTAVASDARADPVLRGLATLLWAQHQLDGGDPAAINARLAPLAGVPGPWRALAQEQLAWLDLRQGKNKDAMTRLRRLSTDTAAPQGVRARASGLLAQVEEAAAPVVTAPKTATSLDLAPAAATQ